MRLLSLLLCLFATTSALGAESALQRAEQAFDALEFDAAAEGFREALKAPGNREERLRAWRGLAVAEASMERTEEAREAFMMLLLLEPDAEVGYSQGPKVRAPFEEARQALSGKRVVLTVLRAPDGRVVATLEQPRKLVVEIMVAVREPGAAGFSAAVGPPPGPVSVKSPPERAVEAYAVARDAAGAILFEQGNMRAPLRLDPIVKPPPAVAAAKEPLPPPPEEAAPGLDAEPERKRAVWPFVVGGVGLAAAGVVLGVVLTRPAPLALPAADQTGRLP